MGGGAALSIPGEELLSWLAVEKGRSPNTLAAYRRDLVAYETWLRSRATLPAGSADGLGVASVEEATVAQYVAYLRGVGLAPSSIARSMVSVRSLHKFLVQEGTAKTDPTLDLKPPPVPQGLPKALSEDDVGYLLAAVTGGGAAQLRDRAVLELLYGTGMRISELTGMSLSDLAVEDQLVRVLGKGRKERMVPLGDMPAKLWPRGWPRWPPPSWCPRGGRGEPTRTPFS